WIVRKWHTVLLYRSFVNLNWHLRELEILLWVLRQKIWQKSMIFPVRNKMNMHLEVNSGWLKRKKKGSIMIKLVLYRFLDGSKILWYLIKMNIHARTRHYKAWANFDLHLKKMAV